VENRKKEKMKQAFSLIMSSLLLLCAFGCASVTPINTLHQAITADDLTVKSGTTLLQTHAISVPQAEQMYSVASNAEPPMVALNGVIQSGGTAAEVASANQLVLTTITSILSEYQEIEANAPALKYKMALTRYPHTRYRLGAKASSVTPADVMTLVELIAALEPGLAGFIEQAFDPSVTVTQATITSDFASLDHDLPVFGGVITSAGGVLPVIITPLPATSP
jgi:hypothetical protein